MPGTAGAELKFAGEGLLAGGNRRPPTPLPTIGPPGGLITPGIAKPPVDPFGTGPAEFGSCAADIVLMDVPDGIRRF